MPSAPSPWVEPAEIELRLASAGVSGADVVRLAQAATDVLYERSGRRWNVETWTVRPTHVSSACSCWVGWDADRYGSEPLCTCFPTELVLSPAPVVRVEEVRVDGAVVASGGYVLYDSRRLVRTDGLTWPCCQRLRSPTTEVGTFAVTFRAGDTVPDAGWLAAAELAYQLGLRIAGSSRCALPERAVSVDRQGINVTLTDVTYLQEGMFGIPVIDQFLLAYGRGPAGSILGPDDVRMRSSGGGLP